MFCPACKKGRAVARQRALRFIDSKIRAPYRISLLVISATRRPCAFASPSSFSLGCREPSVPARVVAPYGVPPLISNIFVNPASLYGKPTMISEMGMDAGAGLTAKSFIVDLMNKVNSASGLGVFYWEPEAYGWCGYSKGAWNTNGRPTVALDAFLQ